MYIRERDDVGNPKLKGGITLGVELEKLDTLAYNIYYCMSVCRPDERFVKSHGRYYARNNPILAGNIQMFGLPNHKRIKAEVVVSALQKMPRYKELLADSLAYTLRG